MTKQICTICGYICDNVETKEPCPQCKAPKSKIKAITSENFMWADEHIIGVAQGIDNSIIEDLRANFLGECTEVGLCVAMSRQADREGYPEIAGTCMRIAMEEAEHAAKFAELLGEVVYGDTKKNLELRVDVKHGACEGKKRLAIKAKHSNLDSIHDMIHEICKDEARHGSAFQGLINRFFGKEYNEPAIKSSGSRAR